MEKNRTKTNWLLPWYALPDSANYHRGAPDFRLAYGCSKLFLNFANFQQMDFGIS